MNFRFSQLHTDKMSGHMVKEYKPISIPQFDEEGELAGFVKAKKIVAQHPIDQVHFDTTGNVVVLQFKDGYPQQLLSSIEYKRIWKEKNNAINKEYDKYHPNRGRVMNIVADKLDIKAQRSE